MYKYIGKDVIIGIPARNLTDGEVEKYGKKRITKSQLWVKDFEPVKSKSWEAAKADEVSNNEVMNDDTRN